ncbi:MAG: hypothetical protein ABIH67_04985 [Candidatus Uhrbacteria bacterium]
MPETEYHGPSPTELKLETIMKEVESVTNEDIEFLATQMNSFEFKRAMKGIAKTYKEKTGQDLEVELVFDIEDPNNYKHYHDKVWFLRQCKTWRETDKHIKKIIIRGPAGTKDLERNVFNSGVTFAEA